MKRVRPYRTYKYVYNWMVKYVVALFILALFGLCSVFIYTFYSQTVEQSIMKEKGHLEALNDTRIFHGKKYAHIDLKGAPPRIHYFEFIFSLFSNIGIDGVLIEYEDMFPYSKSLENISAVNKYLQGDIQTINNLAKKYNLDIIPLVHTFENLEFLLKLKPFINLREIRGSPQTSCISNDESLNLVTEIISQVIESHSSSKSIHIGVDESQFIGRCRKCNENMKKFNISRETLLINYLKKIVRFIKEKYPSINVLMWDDMLRYFSEDEMEKQFKDFEVIPVVRQYEIDVFDRVGPSVWNSYRKVFQKIWFASAYKGASGVDHYIVDMAHHIQNHKSWMNVVNSYKNMVEFEAVIMTGRQRYDHFSVLCELLPVALPSLILNSQILESTEDIHFDIHERLTKLLQCEQPYALMGTSFGTPKCSFIGGKILEGVYEFHRLREEFDHTKKNSIVRGWMSSFNKLYNVSSPDQILKISSQLIHLKKEIDSIEMHLSQALLEVYDSYTKNEWITTYLEPLKGEMQELINIRNMVMNDMNVWPRRPFNF